MEVYFDHAATTKPFKEVIEKMIDAFEEYGNTSSLHNKGIAAENLVKSSKKIFADILKVDEKEIYFTSGGTESNNWSITGTALANRRNGRHIITSSIEHPSVMNVIKNLETLGLIDEYEITIIPVDKNGLIDLIELKEAIREDTILVSIMHVNNELGTIQPIEEIGQIIKEKNPHTLFHVDGVQSFGKFIIHPNKNNIDLLSVSSHKIHGPKGIGLLYIKEKTKIKPLIFGGNHQRGLRSGTENVPGIVGFSTAAQMMYDHIGKNNAYLVKIKTKLTREILNNIEDVFVNGEEEISAPHILNVRFKNIRSEVLMHTLENSQIYVSTGSACSSNKNSISNTLKAIGLNINQIDESIRFSFSITNTEDEVDYCVEKLKKEVMFLRKYVKGGK
ncbi:cysteine desulfurase [Natranaerovirga hydrolytica]|uniref:Cysteine desulfurase n=1 Tax=Natranaerovirga hydrolytica TaxID=680378 RepID=A0A4R1MZ08_9FIRM|nr:cysteine desulfurase family protein [Natranaerovirga hydrolytica]TCK98395.1 cysteine desulfurase [Natranaerovirga hydrolytica]